VQLVHVQAFFIVSLRITDGENNTALEN